MQLQVQVSATTEDLFGSSAYTGEFKIDGVLAEYSLTLPTVLSEFLRSVPDTDEVMSFTDNASLVLTKAPDILTEKEMEALGFELKKLAIEEAATHVINVEVHYLGDPVEVINDRLIELEPSALFGLERLRQHFNKKD